MKSPHSLLRSRKFWALTFLAAASLILREYVKLQPKSWLGQQKFKAGYQLTPDKNAYLKWYWAQVEENDGGWLSPGSNEFLWGKLSHDLPQKEFDAISNFYLSMGSRRWDDNPIDDPTKLKIIDRLISRFPDMDLETKIAAILWIEEFRSQEYLGKGGIYYTDWEHGVTLYERWWNLNLPWSEKKLIYPLEGTTATVDRGP
ncbi:hypothetical protein V2O64_16600 [Verrucomicrobiaceae bacterium 227]